MSGTLDIRIDAGELDRLGTTWARALPALVDELAETMQRSTLEVQAEAIGRAPRSTGELARSIGQSVEVAGARVTGTVGVDADRVPYALTVEYGSERRWFPPVDALEPWVVRTARYDPTAFGGIDIGDEGQVRSAAFLVARAISRRGYRAQPFLRPALEAKRSAVEAEFRGVPRRFVQRLERLR